MKRLLSVLLAIMMVATLLPTAVFATEGEVTESTGIRIKYDLLGAIKKLGVDWENSSTPEHAAKRVSFKNINYALTDGFFSFNDSSCGEFTGHSALNYNSKYGFQISNEDWIAFDIVVPQAGTYTMEMWCGNNYADTKTKVYVGDLLVGEFSNYEENTVDSDATEGQNNKLTKVVDEPRYIEGITFAEAGVYTIKFLGTKDYCSAGTFYLTSGDGNVIINDGISVDKSILDLGKGETATVTAKGFLSATAEAAAFKYASNNAAVAAVDENTGVVTPVSEGKATISAICVDGTSSKVLSKEITVIDTGITIKYDISEYMKSGGCAWATALSFFDGITFETTNGFYDFVTSTFATTNAPSSQFRSDAQGDNIQVGSNTSVTFSIYVPVDGMYTMKIDSGYYGYEFKTDGVTKTVRGVNANVFVTDTSLSGNDAAIAANRVGYYNCAVDELNARYSGTWTDGARKEELNTVKVSTVADAAPARISLTKGYHNITIKSSSYGSIGSVYLTSGTKAALMNGKITSTAPSINKDESETATVSATGFNSATTEAETFTYTSSNTDIAEVDAETGVVTPKAEGKVTITATAKGAEVANALTTDITVTTNKPGEAVADTVKVYIDATTGGSVAADKVAVEMIADAKIGETIKATATANEGYKFAYWKDSMGNVVSESETYTFKAFTNTSIIAVFDDIGEDAETYGVEFFDGNRDYLGFVEVAKGDIFGSIGEAAPTPNLTGYEFKGWSIAENTAINAVLRAVALYEEEGNQVSGVKVNDDPVSDTKYDDEITKTVEGAKAWYRDNKLVGYGDTYTYYVWGNTEITSSTEDIEDKLPLAVLNTSGDAYMLEYDNAGYEIVDAGILFGNDTHKEVNSCYYKAKVKNIKAHGQFTAKKSADTEYPQTVVRGYVMFRDGNDIRVIYAD